jgi:hypothetical protein
MIKNNRTMKSKFKAPTLEELETMSARIDALIQKYNKEDGVFPVNAEQCAAANPTGAEKTNQRKPEQKPFVTLEELLIYREKLRKTHKERYKSTRGGLYIRNT